MGDQLGSDGVCTRFGFAIGNGAIRVEDGNTGPGSGPPIAERLSRCPRGTSSVVSAEVA